MNASPAIAGPGPGPGPGPAGPVFIGSEIYRGSRYGIRHPLSIPRVPLTIDLCRALGWLPDAAYLDSPPATPAALSRFHDPGYVAAVQRAEARQRVDSWEGERYNLGRNGNPVFGEVFRRPATACGASLAAAALLLAAWREGRGAIVYNPAGGTHHGRPDRASGFCFFNDPALAILALLDGGMSRVLYLDVDAHHGDGVQDAFAGDRRVLTVSVHEAGRWPRSGAVDDTAGGSARNLPVPPGFHDAELDHLRVRVMRPLLDAFRPQAVVLQGGCDALAEDPLSRLSLTNRALWRVAAELRDRAPRLLVLGGGGYNPWATARCWAGIWGVLNRLPVPDSLPAPAETLLRAVTWDRSAGRNPPERWFRTLADPPPAPAPVRPEIDVLAAAILAHGLPDAAARDASEAA